MSMTPFDNAVLLTLGRSCVQGRDGAVLLSAGKPYALLAYLAVAPGRTASRGELLDLLWSNLEPERGRATLRQTLFHVRSLLGDGFLESKRDEVRIAGALEVDAVRFSELVAGGRVEEALAIYAGHFLNEFALAGAPEFERWAEIERARLAAIQARASEWWVRRCLDTGRSMEAIERARTLRDLDPLRQNGWRLLIEAHEAAGNVAAAQSEANALESLLSAEQIVAEPATAHRLQSVRVRGSAVSDGGRAAISPEMVGRERDFALILGQFASARSGTPRHVHVRGEAGLGKSRLLTAVDARLSAGRHGCVTVGCHYGERGLSYALLADLADRVAALPGALGVSAASARALVELSPRLSACYRESATPSSGPQPVDVARIRVLAVTELLNAVAEEGPFAVMIDDLQWADAESLVALGGIGHRLRGPILVVTTSRESEPIGDAETAQIELAPLSSESTDELLGSIGLELDPANRTRLCAAVEESCSGNPFLIVQSLELALEFGILEQHGAMLRCADPEALVESVRRGAGIASRIEALDPVAGRVLLALAIGGSPISAPVLAAATTMASERAKDALVELVGRRLATQVSDGWRPAHDRIAEAVMEASTPGELRETRIAVALALRESGVHGDAFRAAARLLIEASAVGELATTARAWLRACRKAGDSRSAGDLVRALLLPAGRGYLNEILRSLPVRERMPIRSAGIAAAVIALLATMAALRREPAVQLYVAQAPSIAGATVDGVASVLQPAPAVELRSAAGQLDPIDDSVTIMVRSGNGMLRGNTTVPLVGGRAVFPRVQLVARGPVILAFRARQSGASARIPFDPAPGDWRAGSLRLVSGRFGSQWLTPGHDALRVGPGQRVSGMVTVEYTTTLPDATIWYAGTPTWGRPDSSYASFGALSSPARDRRRSDLLTFTAPRSPGTWLYVLAMGSEPNAEFLLSATNWVLRKPAWNDGNDLATTQRSVLEAGLRRGWIVRRFLKDSSGTPAYGLQAIAIAGFLVEVENPR